MQCHITIKCYVLNVRPPVHFLRRRYHFLLNLVVDKAMQEFILYNYGVICLEFNYLFHRAFRDIKTMAGVPAEAGGSFR